MSKIVENMIDIKHKMFYNKNVVLNFYFIRGEHIMKQDAVVYLKATGVEYRVNNPIRLRRNEISSIGALRLRGYVISQEKGNYVILTKAPEALIKLEVDNVAGYFCYNLNQYFNRDIGLSGLQKFKKDFDEGKYLITGTSPNDVRITEVAVEKRGKKVS